MRRREFQRNPARPRQANKDMPGHAQRGTDWQRLAQIATRKPRVSDRPRQAQRDTKRHSDANRSPEKPREAQGNPERPSKLRLSDKPQRRRKARQVRQEGRR